MNPVEDLLSTLNGETTDNEMDKEAGFLGNIWRGLKGGFGRSPVTEAMPMSTSMGRAVGEQLPLAAAGVLMAGVGAGIGKGYGAIKERFTKPRDYKAMIEANPTLRKEPAKKVQMLYNSLRTMAPSMAKDPLIAGSFVRNTLELSPESGPAISPQTVKTLVESQRNIADAKGTGSMMRAWTGGETWRGVDPPQKDTPFTMGPGGLSGRFGSAEEAQRFAKKHKMPVTGVEKKPFPQETRYSYAPDKGMSVQGPRKEVERAAARLRGHGGQTRIKGT